MLIILSADDCYLVTINDSYGDGLLGSAGYSLTDAAGTVLFQEVGPAFGYSVIEPFSKSGQVSVNNIKDAGLNVYPNPAQNILNIEGDYKSLNIYDVYGKLVLSTDQVINVDITNLASGVYVLSIDTKQGKITEKITVTK